MATKPTTKRANKAGKPPTFEIPEFPFEPEMQVPQTEYLVAINHWLDGDGVPVWARCHVQTGLRPLIAAILIRRKAVFPVAAGTIVPAPGQDANSPEFVKLAKAHRVGLLSVAVTMQAIADEVFEVFGEGVRYGDRSVATVLSAMVKEGLLGCIRPTTGEERERASKATHVRYWLASDPPPPRKPKRGFPAHPLPKV